MGKTVSIDAGTIVAVLLTHGFVYCSPLPVAGPLSPLTYRGIFQDVVLAIWTGWNFLHGRPPDPLPGDPATNSSLARSAEPNRVGSLIDMEEE
jgi:hypothetical protein